MADVKINADGEEVTIEQWMATANARLLELGFNATNITPEQVHDPDFFKKFEAAMDESANYADEFHKIDTSHSEECTHDA